MICYHNFLKYFFKRQFSLMSIHLPWDSKSRTRGLTQGKFGLPKSGGQGDGCVRWQMSRGPTLADKERNVSEVRGVDMGILS